MESGKNVAVLGIGISGFASAQFLASKNYKVFVSDQGNSELIQNKAAELRRQGIEAETGQHTISRLLECDWAVISPGIPPSSEVVQAFRKAGKPVHSEIEVAGWFCESKKIIAVTGSSGKTTVTTLLGRALSRLPGRTFVCGNIGNPWITEIPYIGKEDFVVLELSSFQLSYCQSFRPQTGLLLNLSQNHQDWHPDMVDYAAAKLRIFQNQTREDIAIIRRTDQAAYFPDFHFQSKILYIDDTAAGKENSPAGKENPNEYAVRLTARYWGCSDEQIDEVFRQFEGIEHRLEKAGTVDGVDYVNDSKCTTTSSLAWALEKYADGKVILIAGGHPKSNDFADVRNLVQKKVKKAVLIGEARPLLKEAWGKSCNFSETSNFKEALEMARAAAAAGDTILLSPACASFDMFQNYIERGKIFKSIVREWAGAQEKITS